MSKTASYFVVCNVHQDGVWAPHVVFLESAIRNAYRNHVDADASIKIMWMQMPKGQAYLAGHPSTASTLLAPVSDNLDQATREKFMHSICDDWQSATDCTVDEIIVNAMDASAAAEYMAISRLRINPAKSKALALKLAAKAMSSKLRQGYLSLESNMP